MTRTEVVVRFLGITRGVSLAIVLGFPWLPASAEGDDAQAARKAVGLGREAYAAEDWAACAEHYSRAGRLASDVQPQASYNAACCLALAGDLDGAREELARAIEAGYRDAAHMQRDSDLTGLRDDPGWPDLVAKAVAALTAYRETVNGELLELYEQDQADRSPTRYEAIDWSEVGPRDEARRARVAEIMASGGATVADDYFHAAMVFQHGDSPEDYQSAHDWALRAVELDPEHEDARWLAAAAEDRRLMRLDRPQKYGTQFRKVDGKWILWEVDPSITDEERARWNVPPLSEALKRVETMNGPTTETGSE